MPASPIQRLFTWALRNARDNKLGTMVGRWLDLFAKASEQAAREPGLLRVLTLLLEYLGEDNMTEQTWMEICEAVVQNRELVEGSLAWKMMIKGRREERAASTMRLLLMLLDERFGRLPTSVLDRVNKASVDELEAWMKNFAHATTLNDVFGTPSV